MVSPSSVLFLQLELAFIISLLKTFGVRMILWAKTHLLRLEHSPLTFHLPVLGSLPQNALKPDLPPATAPPFLVPPGTEPSSLLAC